MDLNASNSLNSTSESQSSIQQQAQEISAKQNSVVNEKITQSANMNEEKMQSNKNQENLKRKKSKLRNSTVPPGPNPHYPKELDMWLENCIKDISAPQLSSSSEFLDYNTSSFTSNKNNMPQSQIFNRPSQTNKFNPVFHKLFQNDVNLTNNPFDVNKIFRNLDHLQSENHGEYASLPPFVNAQNSDNCTENFDSNDPSRSFRFSDPCLIGVSDNESTKLSEQNLTGNKTPNDTNKFLATLLEQINVLHETNSKICRNLHETKVEIEALKHTSWGLRHRRDSLSGLSTHSQPMGFGFGNQSPAPTYHSGVYTPGMMTDVVREVKEAARVREEALLSRVKAMVEERSWSFGEGNIRLMRDVEEMKAQIQHLKSDRKDMNKRITQLEAENKYLKSILISMLNNKTVEIMNENEHIRSNQVRKNVAEPMSARQKRVDISLNHASINHHVDAAFQHASSFDERNQFQKTTTYDNMNKSNQSNYDRRNTNTSLTNSPSSHSLNGSTRTVELFGIPSENERNSDGEHLLQVEKNTLELRRELQEALASKKQAENRVIALENMVKHLQVKVTTHPHSEDCNTSTVTVRNGSITSGSGTTQISNLSSLGQFSSQMQVVSPKLSLAGPITDL